MNNESLRPALLVGLTGGIGSGKTTVANQFGALGVPLIDADEIAHRLTGPHGAAMAAIRQTFGEAVIAADGRLDRAAMRKLAFDDPQARKRLEAILHPMIREETERQIAAAAGAPYAIVVIPLLVEGGNAKERFDRILVVDCPVEVQIERVIQRSGLGRDQVLAIIGAQASREQRLAQADDVLDNGGDSTLLPAQVERLHHHFLELASAGCA
ncbi:MAG: dephospho-CoA kinase [Quisquiliibacterium sp.]